MYSHRQSHMASGYMLMFIGPRCGSYSYTYVKSNVLWLSVSNFFLSILEYCTVHALEAKFRIWLLMV
jgi:hypothetical protein